VCGRYELHSNPTVIALAFGLARPPHVAARYNIAPTDDVPIVRIGASGERELVSMRWGLVPRWAKDLSIGARMINARGESIQSKPSLRMAYRRHRCLLPADGFYEWSAVTAGAETRRVAFHVGMATGSPFGLAGLYERWMSNSGAVVDSCTIVTTEANALLRPLHDRMPLIIAPDDYARWLDPANDNVADLIVPFPPADMAYYPVSARVNSVRNDDPSLIERTEASSPEIGTDGEPAPNAPTQESLF